MEASTAKSESYLSIVSPDRPSNAPPIVRDARFFTERTLPAARQGRAVGDEQVAYVPGPGQAFLCGAGRMPILLRNTGYLTTEDTQDPSNDVAP